MRALAVLVVATPCPLILAAPVAILSGVSRAARAGVIVKGGAAVEQLGEAQTVVLDKTGTLTLGLPEIERLEPSTTVDSDEALGSPLARPALRPLPRGGARACRSETRPRAELPRERQGRARPGRRGGRGRPQGCRGQCRVAAVTRYDVPDRSVAELDAENGAGSGTVLVGVDGRLAAAVILADHLRPDASGLVDGLRAAGIRHVAMATGDRAAVAEEIGRAVGVDRVYAEQSPEEKLELVRSLQADSALRPVVMVGDGVNDAPALALADVGIAMGTAGATVASETADAVILVDRVERVAEAIRIGRRSLAIARQSVLAGIGLSLVAMVFAALGYIQPVFGALLQEGIDVAVILNALRALRG